MSTLAANHTIPTRERLIVALDVPSPDAAMELVERLGDSVDFYKIGLELAMTRGYFDLMAWLIARGKRVFADIKLYDIPATVGAAVRQLSECGASFLTVHGERSVIEAAAANKGSQLKILAVTVLTSIDRDDLVSMGIELTVEELALRRARLAMASGCDGIIASGLEVARLRAELGEDAVIVTPGIRPAHERGADDQKRVVTPGEAIGGGADHIVVGRPIRSAADPYRAASEIQAEIASACA